MVSTVELANDKSLHGLIDDQTISSEHLRFFALVFFHYSFYVWFRAAD